MNRLAGKTALITGASSGIGRAIATKFQAEGATLLLMDVTEAVVEGGEPTHKILNVPFFQGDVSKEADVEEAVRRAALPTGRLDIVVNDAVIRSGKMLTDTTLEEWNRVMEVNVTGVFLMCRAAVRPMRKQKSGRVVVIASTAAFNGGADNSSVYAIGKGGALALAKSLARQVAADNITVNAVAPGGIDTPMGRFGFTDESWNAHYQKNVPLKRAGQPEEVAKAILFLVSDWGSYVTGHTLDVEGGLMLR